MKVTCLRDVPTIQEDTVRTLYQLRIQKPQERKAAAWVIQSGLTPPGRRRGSRSKQNPGEIGRNSPCSRGSGKKYKHCHGHKRRRRAVRKDKMT